jgi:uncharacterized membrane protein YbjE (DUF340 family)
MIIAGIIAGRMFKAKFKNETEKLLLAIILLVIGTMGLGVGAQFKQLNLEKLILGTILVATIPSIASVIFAVILVGKGHGEKKGLEDNMPSSSLLAVASLATGGMLGYVFHLIPPPGIIDFLLALLLFLSGYTISDSITSKDKIVAGGRRGVMLTISCGLGGIVAGVLLGEVMGWNVHASIVMSVASGWYSLAGPLLYTVDPMYGTVAFIGNMLRESLHIILYPVLSRWIPTAAIAIGGATTMDTGLPVIAAFGSSHDKVAGFVQGSLLTILLSIMLPPYVSLTLV